MMTSKAIGIDLGTTYSCVAAWDETRTEVFANNEGDRTTASCVAFNNHDRLIGKWATNQLSRNPENTITNVKRLMGRPYNDPTVQENAKRWPFKVINKDGKPAIEVMFRNEKCQFSPEEVSAMILDYLKKTAEGYLHGSVTKCVITVPAYFNQSQRQATMDAAEIAGLNVLELLNEPTAAALAYGVHPRKLQESQGDHHILVFDFGGGTFDVSVLKINQGGFKVIATGGDSNLGGEDINSSMVDYLVGGIKRKHGLDISNKPHSIQRLRAACERVKRTLSSATHATIDLVDFFANDDDYTATMTRETFEDISKHIFKKTVDIMERTLLDAKTDKYELDEILLVGGSTRIPKIRQLVREFFGKQPNKSVNPDEAVACGAAIHAAVISGDLDEEKLGTNLIVREVTPLSLGVAIQGDAMSTIIERNTPIPIKNTDTYITAHDDQVEMHFKIYQGECKQATKNSQIGSLRIDGFRPSRRGKSKADVTFEINTSGMLNVKVKNLDTQVTKGMEIKTGNLSRQEVKDMVNSAAKLKDMDDIFMKRHTALRRLEDYAYKVRDYAMDEFKGGLHEKEAVISAAMQSRDWIEDNPDALIEEFEQRKDELETIVKPIIGYIY